MTEPLTGRHALVTGASRGIGAATARALAQAGARVTLLARDPARLAEVEHLIHTGGGEAQSAPADLRDARATDAAFAHATRSFGPVDILINNAGTAESRSFARTDPAFWATVFDINVNAAFRCTHLVAPVMLERGWGRIVNVSSTAGLMGMAYVSAYCAAKHALVGFTRALAVEFAGRGVTVNAVCPGYTQTDLLDAAVANVVRRTGRSQAGAQAALLAGAGQSRVVSTDEVAQTIVMLCGAESDEVSGQAIAIVGDAA